MLHQYVEMAFARSFAPYRHTKSGSGILSAKPARAIMVLDQPYPKARYMLGANSGNRNAVKLLANCCAAIALLVCSP